MRQHLSGIAIAVLCLTTVVPALAENTPPAATTTPPAASSAEPRPADVPRPSLIPATATPKTISTDSDVAPHRRHRRFAHRHLHRYGTYQVGYFPFIYWPRMHWPRVYWHRFNWPFRIG